MIKLLALALLTTLTPVTFAGNGDPKNLAIDAESVFKRLDVNGNGKVTREEFTKLRESLSEKAKAITRHGGLLNDIIFDIMDENKDGFVTFDEYKKFRDKTAMKIKKRNGKIS